MIHTHDHAVWRDRANYLIRARTEDGVEEQLWARAINDDLVELCCIPFFAYNASLGDIVEIDGAKFLTAVRTESGRYVFRVFLRPNSGSSRPTLESELRSLGVECTEWRTEHHGAIDASDLEVAKSVANYLQQQEDAGTDFETGRQ